MHGGRMPSAGTSVREGPILPGLRAFTRTICPTAGLESSTWASSGSGRGRRLTLCRLAELSGCETVANDLRSESLESAVRLFHNGPSIRLLSGNLFELDPEDTGRFDLVVACEIIEHVGCHAVEFLEQLRRFVAPGGKVLLTTPKWGLLSQQATHALPNRGLCGSGKPPNSNRTRMATCFLIRRGDVEIGGAFRIPH